MREVMVGIKPKTKALIVVLAVALVATLAVKLFSPRSAKDAYFVFDSQKLDDVPANVVVVRPTQYPDSFLKGVTYGNNSASRVLGRDATFVQLVSAAYGFRPSRIVLPPDAPKGNFDFLATTATNTDLQLQAAIKKEFGYTARRETRDVPVLLLKIETPDSPALQISPDSEKPSVGFTNGIVYFVHQKPVALTWPAERYLSVPVMDRTGLTNFYDFSFHWDWRMQAGRMDETVTKRMLARWGLGLEPGTAPVEMLIVEKTN